MVGETWVTAKRFSDFVELRETLLAAGIQEVAEFAFPSKMTWMKSDDDVQQERVAGFSEWLPKVLARKQVNALDEKALLTFFASDGGNAPAKTNTAVAGPVASVRPQSAPVRPAVAPGQELLGQYVCRKKTIVRTTFEMTSPKADPEILKKGATIVATEAFRNESGVLRVCFGAGQWVSAVSSAGDAILERVSRPQPAPEPSSSWSVDVGGSGVRAGAGGSAAPIPTASEEVIAAFTAVVKSVVRSGAELDSEKVGVVNPGDEVLALAERRVGSTTRVRFSRGWVSVSSSDGATILESVE